MKKVLFFALAVLCAGAANAQKKTFTRDYIYQATEEDSKVTARAFATRRLHEELLREVGEFLQTDRTLVRQSTMKNGREELTEDYSEKIMAITAGVVEMKILNEVWNGKTYYVLAKMTVDPAEINRRLKEVRDDKQKTQELEESRRRALAAEAEAERLRRELALEKNKNNAAMKQAYQQQAEALRKTEWDKEQERLAAQRRAARSSELDEPETELFFSYRFSLTSSYGFQFGVCKRWGGYAQLSGNMSGVGEYDLKEAALYTYSAADERRYFRRSFTAGGMVRPVRSWNWFLYAGAGFGKYGATYLSRSDWYYYSPPLISGLELEGGVTLAYKFVNASVGYSFIPGSRLKELHFGLGFNF